MTREEAIRSIEAGIEIVNELQAEAPVDLLGTGIWALASPPPLRL